MLQNAAVCCGMLQRVAVSSSGLIDVSCGITRSLIAFTVLQCVAVCCSVFQYVAVCCSVLQCVATCGSELQWSHCLAMRDDSFSHRIYIVAMLCSVLQCVAVYCSMLQYVAVCCSEF